MSDPISSEAIQAFTKGVREGSFAQLLEIELFYEELIIPILRSGPQFVYLFKVPLENLLNVLDQRIQSLPQIREKLPGLVYIMKEIRQAIGADTNQQVQRSLPTEDRYFVKFLRDEEIKLKNPNNSSYYDIEENGKLNQKIKLRMPALISTRNFKKEWQIVFTTLKEESKITKDQTFISKKGETYKNLRDSGISFPQCMGCTEFFYERVNIRDLELSYADVIVIPKVRELNYHKDVLKTSICALLNSGGGVLLFDCLEEYMQILPIGTYISELQKELYQQQISELFKHFRPKLSFGVNVHINFVPIVENPFENPASIKNIKFQRGRYVIRLRIWNNERYRLTFFEDGNGDVTPYFREHGQTVKLSGRPLRMAIKRIFKKYYCPQRFDRQIFEVPQNCFKNHRCIEPKMGLQIETSRRDRPEQLTEYDLEVSFHYVSIMFLREESIETIEKGFKRLSAGKFQLVPHQPPTVDNYCLFFHDTAHKQIKEIFNSITGNARRDHLPVLLFVENGLQLSSRLQEVNFSNLMKYIKSKNSTETLKYFEGDNKYFITADFKVTLFFLFAKLREMNYRNTKIVKMDVNRYENDEDFRKIEAPADYYRFIHE